MIMNLISLVDRLFCETKIETTVITRRYDDPKVFDAVIKDAEDRGLFWRWIVPMKKEEQTENAVDEDCVQSTIKRTENYFTINGKRIQIPRVIQQRRPILKEDGNPDFETFPDFRDGRKLNCMFVEAGDPWITKFSYDGIPLSRKPGPNGATKGSLETQFGWLIKEAGENPAVITSETQWYDMQLAVSHFANDVMLTMTLNDLTLRIYQTNGNVDRYKSHRECVLSSYAFARAALLTLAMFKQPIQDIEEGLAVTLIALFLKD